MNKVGVAFLVAALAMLVVAELPPVVAQNCNPLQLISCAGAISNPNSEPSSICCSGLRRQEPCFCQYLNDPTLSQYFTPATAQRLAAACEVTIPTNCN